MTVFSLSKGPFSHERCSVKFRHVSPQSVSGFGGFSTNITLKVWDDGMFGLDMSANVGLQHSTLTTQSTAPFLIDFVSVAVFKNILI